MADDVLILIPARMAATRLPGKPLADIAGAADDRARACARAEAADVGPVVVATDAEAIAAAVEKAGGRAVMTRADHASGSDRIFEALGGSIPRRRAGSSSTCRAICRRSSPATSAPRSRRSPIPRSTSPRSPPRSPGRTSAPIRTWSRWSARRSRRAGLRALYFTRATAPYGEGRSTTTSGSTPIAAPRSSASSSCRPRRSNSARSSSSCARSKPACASTWRIVDTVPLGVDTPEDLETRARHARHGR